VVKTSNTDTKGQVSGFRFQVSGFRFQVSGFRFQVSGFSKSKSEIEYFYIIISDARRFILVLLSVLTLET